MKRFLAGLVVGILGSVLVFAAQHRASEKIVQPQVLVDNTKVKAVRWVLAPGEGTPIHTHSLDHISVVIHGSTLRDVEASNGVAKENVQKTGDVTYVPARGQTHSFANAGKTTFESIAIELK
jgi:quercetin dioxygenase-like cupin family protein